MECYILRPLLWRFEGVRKSFKLSLCSLVYWAQLTCAVSCTMIWRSCLAPPRDNGLQSKSCITTNIKDCLRMRWPVQGIKPPINPSLSNTRCSGGRSEVVGNEQSQPITRRGGVDYFSQIWTATRSFLHRTDASAKSGHWRRFRQPSLSLHDPQSAAFSAPRRDETKEGCLGI